MDEQKERFRRALEARTRARLDAADAALLDELIAVDARWHGTGDSIEGARGKDEIIGRWNAAAQDGAGYAHLELADLYVDNTHVVAISEVPVSQGRTIRQATVFHLNERGQAAEIWSLPESRAITEALARGEEVPQHPNVAPFRAAEEARARNSFGPEDMALIERFLREDVRWISPWGEGPNNRQEVIQQFEAFKQATGGTMALTLEDVFADETHAISLVRLTADRPDRPDKHMDVREANVFHLDAEGRAREFWGVADDQSAIDSFWT